MRESLALILRDHFQTKNMKQMCLKTLSKTGGPDGFLSALHHILSYLIHWIIPFRPFGPPYLTKATAAARAALPSPTSACWVFPCFRNAPNFDMDYYTWSFLCVRICTGGYMGNTDNDSAHFWLRPRKILTIFSCAPDRVRTSGSLGLESDALPIEPPQHNKM